MPRIVEVFADHFKQGQSFGNEGNVNRYIANTSGITLVYFLSEPGYAVVVKKIKGVY